MNPLVVRAKKGRGPSAEEAEPGGQEGTPHFSNGQSRGSSALGDQSPKRPNIKAAPALVEGASLEERHLERAGGVA